jgi:asparagine synthase (glutamine-hydrolysing)
MYNGLEVRSPFLSKSIVDFSIKLSNKYKIKNGKTKLILKELSEKKLPKIISQRRKHGFAIPLAKMMRGPLKEKIEDTLLSSNNMISDIFNRVNVEKTLKNHWEGIDNRKPLWAIYMLYKTSERLSKC